MSTTCDFLVIGAGMAGASVASELADHASVIVVDMEASAGYHSTGRSAASWIENYGNDDIVALNRASLEFLSSPPEDFPTGSVVSPRGVLWLCQSDAADAFDETATADGVVEIDQEAAVQFVSALKTDSIARVAYEKDALDIDVARLHQAHLTQLRQRGGEVRTGFRVHSLGKVDGRWRVISDTGDELYASTLVNAAGAWADEVASVAGVKRCGLAPKRRSAAIIPVPPKYQPESDAWPITVDSMERFYFRPETGTLMLSPADTTEVEPHDAYADDLAIAEAAHIFGQVMKFEVERVTHTWGGLRTFAPDGTPVVGMDNVDGFFWLAGQGGYGIQTSPAMARLAAGLLLGNELHASLAKVALNTDNFAPQRFA